MKIWNWIKKELSIKIDFVNDKYNIGFIWVIYVIIMVISFVIDLITCLI